MTTTAYPPSIGGVQSYLADLCKNLQRFDPDVVTLWLKHRTDWLLGTTIRLGETPAPEAMPGVRTIGWSRSARAQMVPWVAAYYASVPIAARHIADLMVPYLDRMVRHEHSVIHGHRIGREFLAQASLMLARKRGLPFVLTPYHHPRWHGYRYKGWTNVYRAADAVLTLTAAEITDLVRLGVPRERLHVIGAAVEQPMTGNERRFRAQIKSEDHPIILFIGQQYEYKGVGRLVVAADALHASGLQFELVFIGPETRFSRKLFARHCRPWLHVFGGANDQFKWDAIEAAAVICVPSSQESFGLVFLEAWSKRKPVIGGRIPAVSEVITDGETGLLVDPSSVAELASAIENLLTNRELSDRLGSTGADELKHRFTWTEVASRVEAAYDSVLIANGAARN